MTANLIAAAMTFVLLHRVVSGSPVRARLATRMGEAAYLRAFGIVSIIAFGWLTLAYLLGPAAPASAPSRGGAAALAGVSLLSTLLIVAGASTRNPGTVNQQAEVHRSDVVQGALRITRHPFLWGTALIALGHMALLGDAASLVYFGTLAFVALTGTLSIDAKRQRVLGEDWRRFADATSNLPLAAIVSGRQRLPLRSWLREIGWRRIAGGVVLWIVGWALHPSHWG